MHACGHDGHMAMALTEAKILSEHKDAWAGKVLFVFEQAEEIGEREEGIGSRYGRSGEIEQTARGGRAGFLRPDG